MGFPQFLIVCLFAIKCKSKNDKIMGKALGVRKKNAPLNAAQKRLIPR